MSVLSTLALLATAVSARIRPKPVAEAAEDPARAIADLEAQRDEYRRAAEKLRRELELERQFTAALAQRLAQQRQPTPLEQFVAQQNQLAMQNPMAYGLLGGQHALVARLNALTAQQAQLEAHGIYNQGLLGAQKLAMFNEMRCNCVPSRAQVWAAGGDDT
jgi:hypothetical protein